MKRIAIVVRGFDLQGAVAASSLNQAKALSKEYTVEIITDTRPVIARPNENQVSVRRVEIVSLN